MVKSTIVKGKDKTGQRKLEHRSRLGEEGNQLQSYNFNQEIKAGFIEKVTFEHIQKGGEGTSCVDVWEETFQVDEAASTKALRWKWA